MSTVLNVILEIVKISVPALIVFVTVYYLMKTYLDKQYQLKQLEYKQSQQKITIPLRLQAYERLSLFCERISVPNLLLRINDPNLSAAALRLKLLLTIQQEFEYNITQQVYISEQLWQIIKISREDTMTIIDLVGDKVDPKAPGKVFSEELLSYFDSQSNNALDKALIAIKREATILM